MRGGAKLVLSIHTLYIERTICNIILGSQRKTRLQLNLNVAYSRCVRLAIKAKTQMLKNSNKAIVDILIVFLGSLAFADIFRRSLAQWSGEDAAVRTCHLSQNVNRKNKCPGQRSSLHISGQHWTERKKILLKGSIFSWINYKFRFYGPVVLIGSWVFIWNWFDFNLDNYKS